MSREISFLESELFRLEQEHAVAVDAEARGHLAKQILKHCRRLGQIEAMGGGSDLIRPDEWFKRYSRPEASAAVAGATPAAAPAVATPHAPLGNSAAKATQLFGGDFEKQIESLSVEPYDPQRYDEKKTRIESLMANIVAVRSASPSSSTLAEVLARLWAIAVAEDDAHEIYLRTARRG